MRTPEAAGRLVRTLLPTTLAAYMVLAGCSSPGSSNAESKCDPTFNNEQIDPTTTRDTRPWILKRETSDSLHLTYFADCSLEVRGEVTPRYPLGPLLQDYWCNKVGRITGIFVEPGTLPDEELDSRTLGDYQKLNSKLAGDSNSICSDGRIEPGEV